MEPLYNIIVAAHLIGMALLVGTFFVQMRASWGFAFPIMLTGASIQLVTGIALYGMQIADGDPNHMKLGIKSLIAVAIFVAALVGLLQQRKAKSSQAQLSTGGGVAGAVAGAVDESRLKPMFHAAGGLAFVNVLIAAIWK